MRLLLLLSALIAGMTGLIAGSPASARASEPTAIAAALSGAVEQAQETAEARRVAEPSFRLVVAAPGPRPVSPEFQPQLHPVDERRIE